MYLVIQVCKTSLSDYAVHSSVVRNIGCIDRTVNEWSIKNYLLGNGRCLIWVLSVHSPRETKASEKFKAMIRNQLRKVPRTLLSSHLYLFYENWHILPSNIAIFWCKDNFNSHLIRNFWVFCFVYLDPGEVFLILIFTNFGIMSKFKHCMLKYVLTLHLIPCVLNSCVCWWCHLDYL